MHVLKNTTTRTPSKMWISEYIPICILFMKPIFSCFWKKKYGAIIVQFRSKGIPGSYESLPLLPIIVKLKFPYNKLSDSTPFSATITRKHSINQILFSYTLLICFGSCFRFVWEENRPPKVSRFHRHSLSPWNMSWQSAALRSLRQTAATQR